MEKTKPECGWVQTHNAVYWLKLIERTQMMALERQQKEAHINLTGRKASECGSL